MFAIIFMGDIMFIEKVTYNKENVDSTIYPFNLPVLSKLDELEFKKPVTFLIGENGSGKSTLIEALAILCKINPEGGSQNYMFNTKDTHSNLHEHLKLSKGIDRPVTKYFLRAETFYNTCSYIDENLDALGAFGFKSLHECSHGESFIKLVQDRFYDRGLYILDEPEAALSPSRQLTLLCLIDDLVKGGSQLIIATHSPILLSYPNATIYNLDDNFKEITYMDTDIYNLYKTFINSPNLILKNLFN